MTIPAKITTDLAILEAQVVAATPLINAGHSTIVALQLNAANLVAEIQTELVKPSNLLDTYSASVNPVAMIKEVLSLLVVAQDQNKLSLIRGVVGRATSNLDQI